MQKTFFTLVLGCFHTYIFCQNISNKPLQQLLAKPPLHSNISPFLNKKTWDILFPHRYQFSTKNKLSTKKDFYSFDNFVSAAKLFPKFLGEGNDSLKRRELSAFFAHISQETSGGWATAPNGYFKWGLVYVQEQNTSNLYADTSKHNYPPVMGVSYMGRGPKQLSWNYNYGQFSEAWYGLKDSLLLHPERLAQDGVMSFASAIWFWMTPQFPKPSCHDIMLGKWKPTENDLQKGRLPGFGTTVNVVNGGIECGNSPEQEKTKYRYQYFGYFCQFFKVNTGPNISCQNQTAFGK